MMEIDPKKSYLISVDGSMTEITPINGKEFELEEAQRHVEGYIQVVQLNQDQIMIVNENGKIEELRYNFIATGIAEMFHALWTGDYICGNAIVCPSSMLT